MGGSILHSSQERIKAGIDWFATYIDEDAGWMQEKKPSTGVVTELVHPSPIQYNVHTVFGALNRQSDGPLVHYCMGEFWPTSVC